MDSFTRVPHPLVTCLCILVLSLCLLVVVLLILVAVCFSSGLLVVF